MQKTEIQETDDYEEDTTDEEETEEEGEPEEISAKPEVLKAFIEETTSEPIFQGKADRNLYKWLTKISSLIDTELTISLTPQGWKVEQLDTSACALINTTLKSFKSEKEQRITFDIGKARAILKHLSDVDLAIYEDRIVFSNSYGKKYQLRLFDTEKTPTTTPKIDFTDTLTIDAYKFQEAIQDFANIGADSIEFDLGNRFILRGYDDTKTIKAEIELKDKKGALVQHKPFITTYATEYLKKIFKNAEGEVELCFGKDLPARFNFNISDRIGYSNSKEIASFSFILAPRIS